jgi:hypothetical protein
VLHDIQTSSRHATGINPVVSSFWFAPEKHIRANIALMYTVLKKMGEEGKARPG